MKNDPDKTTSLLGTFSPIRGAAALLSMTLLLLPAGHRAFAGSATWDFSPSSTNWNTAANWTPNVVPNSSADTATFRSSDTTGISLSANIEVNGITFDGPLPSTFIISVSAPAFILSGLGVTNDSGKTQNFSTASGGGSGGAIFFSNSATAGSQTVFRNNGSAVSGGHGGNTVFDLTATAGNAAFINNGATGSGGGRGKTIFLKQSSAGNGVFDNSGGVYNGLGDGGGVTEFQDSATAANGLFTNQAGTGANTISGHTLFLDSSTAGDGTFRNKGSGISGEFGGDTTLTNTSTAANGIFINDGGTAPNAFGGTTLFNGNSTAADGTFTTNAGTVDDAVGGRVVFWGSATAGNGTFTTNGGAVSGGGFGTVYFEFSSTAGHGTFINNGGEKFGTSGGLISFGYTSTASYATFTNHAGAKGASGGRVQFQDNATAGNGAFTNNGGPEIGALGGSVIFYDDSTAENAAILSNGGSALDSKGGTFFNDNSSAGSATIYAYGSFVSGGGGGWTFFFGSSSAGNATLIANGGQNGGEGGIIRFHDNSDGALARVNVSGNGRLDISPRNAPGVTIGSLEGDGGVFLGSRTLIVGNNNLSTTFNGVIQDGGGGGGIGGSLTKIGPSTLILSRANTYTGGTTITAGRLLVNNASGSGVGNGPVTVNNSGRVLGGIGTVGGPVTINAGAILSGGDAATATDSLKIANNITLHSGAVIELGLGPSGAHSTLSRTGGTWMFASNQAFAFINVGAQPGTYDNIITGLAADPGGTASWTITTPGFAGSFSYDGTGNIDLTLTAAPNSTHPINLSTRMRVETGDNLGIGGFIITGSDPKHVLIRAIGPSLAQYGVPDVLADPVLELHGLDGFTTITNDNWRDTQPNEIQATGIPPTNDFESAIDATLAPGAYTALASGKNNTSGVALVEIYDLGQAALSKLANLSTRAFVGSADNIVIAGVVLSPGNSNGRVAVRGIGPSLSALGVPFALPNPTLELRDSNGVLLLANHDWQDNPAQAAELSAAGLALAHQLESGIVAILPPGLYTALLAGLDNGNGIGLVEVYDLGPE